VYTSVNIPNIHVTQ